MRYREPYPMTKVTLWIRAEDWPWLQARYPYGASRVIRDLIIEHRREIEELEAPRKFEEVRDLEGTMTAPPEPRAYACA
jgi:hypothetical protein